MLISKNISGFVSACAHGIQVFKKDTDPFSPFSESYKPQNGFTIIELVIITVIIGVMATLSVTNFQAGREDEALRINALRIAESIRTAQNYAQSGIHKSYVSARAYGVYVKKPDTVIMFSDNAGDANKVGVWEEQSNDEPIGEPVSLIVGAAKKSISIDGISIDGANTNNDVHIGFRVLTASGLINGKSEGGVVTITLRSSKNNHTKSVTINRLTGRVNAEY